MIIQETQNTCMYVFCVCMSSVYVCMSSELVTSLLICMNLRMTGTHEEQSKHGLCQKGVDLD